MPATPYRSTSTAPTLRAFLGRLAQRPDEYPDWLEQIWFAGIHSDVGGAFPDISIVHAAKTLPDGKTADGVGIKVNDQYVKLRPDTLCPHDERELGLFGGRFKWDEGLREVQSSTRPCSIDFPPRNSAYFEACG